MTAITLLLELLAIYLHVLSPFSFLSFYKYLLFCSKCQVGCGAAEMKRKAMEPWRSFGASGGGGKGGGDQT